MVCKIMFCSKFLDIPDNAGRKASRRRIQAIAKGYAFDANTVNSKLCINFIIGSFDIILVTLVLTLNAPGTFQRTFTYSNSTTKTLQKDMNYVQS